MEVGSFGLGARTHAVAWVNSTGHAFIYRRPLSGNMARTVLAVGGRMIRARTYKRLLRGGLSTLIETFERDRYEYRENKIGSTD